MQHPDLTHAPRALLGPAEPEIGCELCFEELDRCPACREEYESLRDLVDGGPPGDAGRG